MAHGKNAEKFGHMGREWWSRRPYNFHPISDRSKTNKFFKRLVHKIERMQGKKQIEEELNENTE